MAETDPKNTPADPPKDDGKADDPEKSYWDKMGKMLDERISAGVDNKIRELKGNAGTGTSRTGRTTIPKVLADLFFPEPKQRQE